VLDDWLEFRSARHSPGTVDRDGLAIQHVRPTLEKLAVARVETAHIEDLYGKLHRGGMSGASVRKIHWAMRQSLAWAKRRGYVTHLATEGVELPPLGAKRIDPRTSEAVSTLIDFVLAADPEFGTISAFIAWTGCRRGADGGLKWKDIDLERQQRSLNAPLCQSAAGGWRRPRNERVSAYWLKAGVHPKVTSERLGHTTVGITLDL
jgi:integrase